MAGYYLPDGTPGTVNDYERICREQPDLWRVAREDVADGNVSTVWLGFDHQYGDGPPLIYETLATASNMERIERYATREEAERGHPEMVAWVRRTAWRRWLANRLLKLADRVGGEHFYAG